MILYTYYKFKSTRSSYIVTEIFDNLGINLIIDFQNETLKKEL